MKKEKHCENENEDRLSDLPDCVLLHILSLFNTKHAVQTCILSTRWKYLWKRIPTLTLHSSGFSIMNSFTTFVSKILTLRDSSTPLHALDLDCNVCNGNIVQSQLLQKILKYVSSHNSHLKELGISVRGDSTLILQCVSSCQALTSLKLSIYPEGRYSFEKTLFPKSLKLPALTSLDLTNFSFCGDESGRVDPFLAFKMLNSLVIRNCEVRDAHFFAISSETLVDLSINNRSYEISSAIIELCAPSLCTFNYIGDIDQRVCGRGFPSIAICTLQILSSLPHLLKDKCPSLCNLKSLKVNPSHQKDLKWV